MCVNGCHQYAFVSINMCFRMSMKAAEPYMVMGGRHVTSSMWVNGHIEDAIMTTLTTSLI